jgi:predicted XRE-type DNA-binding protein
MENLKLWITKKNSLEESLLTYITRDGWVVGEYGACGDHEEDCTIHLDTTEYLKKFRKDRRLSQQEMSWILGITRPVYSAMELNKGRELTLREYLILQKVDSVFK